MSQAHFLRCCWRFGEHLECGAPAIAHIRRNTGFRIVESPACADCLNRYLDLVDGRSDGGYWWTFPEPLAITWLWDAGTRTCPLHHWPDVLCRDWSAEHAALAIKAAQGFADALRSLTT